KKPGTGAGPDFIVILCGLFVKYSFDLLPICMRVMGWMCVNPGFSRRLCYCKFRKMCSVGLDLSVQPHCKPTRRSDNKGRCAAPTGKCEAFERRRKRPIA